MFPTWWPKSWTCSDEGAEIRAARRAKQRAEEAIRKVKSRDAEVDHLVDKLSNQQKPTSLGGLLTLSSAGRST